MSKAQHFKSVWSEAAPAAGDLSELLDYGWDTVSIVHSQDRYITYLKRVETKTSLGAYQNWKAGWYSKERQGCLCKMGWSQIVLTAWVEYHII